MCAPSCFECTKIDHSHPSPVLHSGHLTVQLPAGSKLCIASKGAQLVLRFIQDRSVRQVGGTGPTRLMRGRQSTAAEEEEAALAAEEGQQRQQEQYHLQQEEGMVAEQENGWELEVLQLLQGEEEGVAEEQQAEEKPGLDAGEEEEEEGEEEQLQQGSLQSPPHSRQQYPPSSHQQGQGQGQRHLQREQQEQRQQQASAARANPESLVRHQLAQGQLWRLATAASLQQSQELQQVQQSQELPQQVQQSQEPPQQGQQSQEPPQQAQRPLQPEQRQPAQVVATQGLRALKLPPVPGGPDCRFVRTPRPLVVLPEIRRVIKVAAKSKQAEQQRGPVKRKDRVYISCNGRQAVFYPRAQRVVFHFRRDDGMIEQSVATPTSFVTAARPGWTNFKHDIQVAGGRTLGSFLQEEYPGVYPGAY